MYKSELGDKVEIDVYCDLTTRQKKLYQQLRSQISMLDTDLLELESNSTSSDSSLANLVMQFRKFVIILIYLNVLMSIHHFHLGNLLKQVHFKRN